MRSFFFEAMAVDRLKGAVKFLEQCRGADDFETIQKKQYDVLLQELEQVRQMNHEEAAEALSLLKTVDFESWFAIASSDCPLEAASGTSLQTWFESSKRRNFCNAHYGLTSHRPRALH